MTNSRSATSRSSERFLALGLRGRARLLRGVTAATLCVLCGHPTAHAAGIDPTGPPQTAGGDADGDPDLVETIDPAATFEPAAAAQSPTLPVPAARMSKPVEPDRFELHGWARQSLEVGLSRLPTDRPINEAGRVPHDQMVTRSQLFARARYSHERWFEAQVSGALSYSLSEHEPADPNTRFNGVNGRSARGVVEPTLQELFVGFFTGPLDVRVGQQRVAWGNTDFMSPNDVMNARDLRDPFLSETELRHLPSLMVRADVDLGFATLQGIIEPAYTPDRYDVYGSNWAGVQPDAPVWARGLANLASRSLDGTLQENAQRLFMATRYPKSDLTEPVLGARLSWSTRGVDVHYYYQYGFDGPLIRLDPAFAGALGAIDFNHAGLTALEPWLAAIDAGGKPLEASYIRRHHVGIDIGTTLGPVALRLDAAYESKRVFFQRDLLGYVSPTVQGVLSMEYQTGDKNKLALLELMYLRLVDAPLVPLLIYKRDTVGAGADLRWPLWHALGFEVRGLFGVMPRSLTVQPELNLKFEHWTLSGGALWLDGEAYSLGRHFRRNIESYAKFKYFF